MRMSWFVLPLAAVAALQPLSAAMFTNGDFELPGTDQVRNQILDGDPATVSSVGILTGWGHAGGSFDLYESDDTGDGLSAQSGSHYISFGHSGASGGSLFQTFDVVVGRTYSLSYFVAEQQGDDPLQNLQATLTNGAQTIVADNVALMSSFAAGTSITFVATASAATITFLDATPDGAGGGSNLALDSVSVKDLTPATSTVPEPASWLTMAGGFAAIGCAQRRRRRLSVA